MNNHKSCIGKVFVSVLNDMREVPWSWSTPSP
jgi:hypothetical protein